MPPQSVYAPSIQVTRILCTLLLLSLGMTTRYSAGLAVDLAMKKNPKNATGNHSLSDQLVYVQRIVPIITPASIYLMLFCALSHSSLLVYRCSNVSAPPPHNILFSPSRRYVQWSVEQVGMDERRQNVIIDLPCLVLSSSRYSFGDLACI